MPVTTDVSRTAAVQHATTWTLSVPNLAAFCRSLSCHIQSIWSARLRGARHQIRRIMEETLPRFDFLRRLGAVIDFASSSHRRAALVLTVFAFTCFLQGIISLPPTNRDESRFAQATKQMFETGDFIDIRFQDMPRYRKPIGIYWLQAVSVSAAKAL